MKIEVRGRRSGKTTESAEWIKEGRNTVNPVEDRLLLVPTEEMARYIRDEHRLTARECMSWDVFEARGHGRIPVIRIENATALVEMLVEMHFMGQVDSIHFDAESINLMPPDQS